MKKTVYPILIILFFLIATVTVNAQPILPGTPSQAPIDGGLGLLAAAGGAYALRKLRANRSN